MCLGVLSLFSLSTLCAVKDDDEHLLFRLFRLIACLPPSPFAFD